MLPGGSSLEPWFGKRKDLVLGVRQRAFVMDGPVQPRRKREKGSMPEASGVRVWEEGQGTRYYCGLLWLDWGEPGL